MERTWPQFVTLQPLDGTHAWTATFDRYDQDRDKAYYCVRLFDQEQQRQTGELIAEVATKLAPGTASRCSIDPSPAVSSSKVFERLARSAASLARRYCPSSGDAPHVCDAELDLPDHAASLPPIHVTHRVRPDRPCDHGH
jgi:hypothetical protein